MVKPREPVLAAAGTIHATDHDSRVMRTRGQPPLQGYDAQLVVNKEQVIVAAEAATVEAGCDVSPGRAGNVARVL